MMMAWVVSVKETMASPRSGSSRITAKAAMPNRMPKITTAMMEVGRAPVRSWNMLVGTKRTSMSANPRSDQATRASHSIPVT